MCRLGLLEMAQGERGGHAVTKSFVSSLYGKGGAFFLVVVAFGLRLWSLGADSLWYDEAATAMKSRPPLADIVRLHWPDSFQHSPLWAILMHAWSRLFGQSEFALRALPALTGVLGVILLWRLTCRFAGRRVAFLAGLLAAISPTLVYYSQEARMYAPVIVLSLASSYLFMDLCCSSRDRAEEPATERWRAVAYVLVNWVMLGLHYGTVLGLVVQSAFYLTIRHRLSWRIWVLLQVASIAPAVLWIGTSPGMRSTLEIVSGGGGLSLIAVITYLDRVWRDFVFANPVYQPAQSWVSYFVLPLYITGLVYAWLRPRPDPLQAVDDGNLVPWSRYFALLSFVPVLLGALMPRYILARYVIVALPALLIILALPITALEHQRRPLGLAVLSVPLLVSALALSHFYTDYRHSEYRQAISFLRDVLRPGDGIAIDGPRQHLLYKYYFPDSPAFYVIPDTELPESYPVTGSMVVPHVVAEQLQGILSRHERLWLVLSGEDELDPGFFVEKYLLAVSYRVDCISYLDLRLCLYHSPAHTPVNDTMSGHAVWEDALQLRGAGYTMVRSHGSDFLLVRLDWEVLQPVAADYQITLRVEDGSGALIAQSDQLPIGPLRPPTTWSSGETLPGYTALPLPPNMARGEYRLVVGLYDPADLRLREAAALAGEPLGDMVEICRINLP